MEEKRVPGLSVDEIMWRIQEEVSRQKELASLESVTPGEDAAEPSSEQVAAEPDSGRPSLLSRVLQERITPKESYHLDDFLAFHDEAFVKNAYLGVLGREADAQGLEYYVAGLRRADFSKVEILGRLRFSEEGKAKGVPIEGLERPYFFQRLCRLPVVGYLFRLGADIVRLPHVLKGIREFQNHAFAQSRLLDMMLDRELRNRAYASSVEFLRRRLEQQVQNRAYASSVEFLRKRLMEKAEMDALDELREVCADKADMEQLKKLEDVLSAKAEQSIREGLDAMERTVGAKADAAELRALWTALEAKADTTVVYAQLTEQRRDIRSQERRVLDLLQRIETEPGGGIFDSKRTDFSAQQENGLLDAMYVAFEDRFRGRREDVRTRQEEYLPYIRQALGATEGGVVVDIGCGRGEWLEILQDNDIAARGLDFNPAMVEECRQKGLDVDHGDALSYLRGAPRDTISVVTGFHILEHLEFGQLVAIVSACREVLKPGGLVVFETPNPKNLVVGACNFYSDPSHKKPLFPETLQFILSYHGFVDTAIHYTNPVPGSPFDLSKETERILNDWFFSARDYAVIGWKR